jgi:exo-1,4-beta-D-glucosaminidase
MTAPSKSTWGYWVALGLVLAFGIIPSRVFADSTKTVLHDGWLLQSSCKVSARGEQISVAGFRPEGWHETTVPSTVVAALVADGTFPDPYFGQNLRSIPGTTYPIGKIFSALPMPDDSPFYCSWWYRTEFRVADGSKGRHVWLHFDGINNRANIWLNGHKIAGPNDVAGAYRTYEFEISSFLRYDRPNSLAIEAMAPTEHDLGINWVDWNPAPPDKDMGLWRDVYLYTTGAVEIRYPQVITHFDRSAAEWNLDRANLTVEADLRNASRSAVSGTLEARIEDSTLRRAVTLAPGETRTVRFTPAEFPLLHIRHPHVWWPRQMGTPTLRPLLLRFSAGDRLTDSIGIQFGIREVTSELDPEGHRIFSVNGKRILIRGAGWAPDMLLRESSERLQTEFGYILDLNLNAVRLEGKMESDQFYDLADREGILILAGWCCCDYWEQWAKWKPADLSIATASLRSQILRMRTHPSMLVWLNGSDRPPPANVERAYIDVLKQTDWPNPFLSSASETPTTVTGATGLKMTGPYSYVPPDYWLEDNGKYGGAFGFIAETSPGAAIPPLSSLRKMLPVEDISPQSAGWNYHAGSARFQDSHHFEDAMNATYGPPSGMEDYERKAQAMAYDAERAMFEGYSRNKYRSTGVIQWMLNNAWPSLIWHLYDYYLQPAGGYFGAKKACEPMHVQYSYDDRSVDVVNSTYAAADRLTVQANLYNSAGRETFSGFAPLRIDADSVARALIIPDSAFVPGSPIYFVKLTLQDSQARTVSRNVYWLSAKKTVYDWTKGSDPFIPVSSYEDLTALGSLPSAGKLDVSAHIDSGPQGSLARVTLGNPSPQLAFQVRLGIRRHREDTEILPVLWEDNYIELMPGETREITAQFPASATRNGDAELSVTGWNITPATLPVPGTQ